jgi:hypothetical protein
MVPNLPNPTTARRGCPSHQINPTVRTLTRLYSTLCEWERDKMGRTGQAGNTPVGIGNTNPSDIYLASLTRQL